MAKQIIFNDDVRSKLITGIKKLSNAVKVTLGPTGRVVLSARDFRDPYFTKDGVTVAREIELPDVFENMGAQIVRQATSKTAIAAGDGTTTATIYVEAIYEAGLKSIANGAKGQEVKRGIEMAVNAIIEEIGKLAKPVISAEQLVRIGICSANHDEKIGTTVAEAIQKVGKDGVVTIEEGQSLETYVDIIEGMQIERGYISANFVNNKETNKVEYEEPIIIVVDEKISAISQIIKILEQLVKQYPSKGLVIIAEDIDGEALSTLSFNHVRGSFKVCAIKAPAFGDRRRDILGDIATVVGATLIGSAGGIRLDQTVLSKHAGTCRKITIGRDDTIITHSSEEIPNTLENVVKIEREKQRMDAISERISLVQSQIDNIAGDFDREKLQERLAKLTGGVGRIVVGGITESEVREKKDRIDDALHACKAAVDEGILPGGGVAVIYARKVLKKLMAGQTEDTKIGIKIIEKALEAPLRQLAKNAGDDDGAVLGQVLRSSAFGYGYNAATGEYGDMVRFGVIVPAKVERVALQNAASVAGLLLVTDCMIAPIPEQMPAGYDPSALPQMPQ